MGMFDFRPGDPTWEAVERRRKLAEALQGQIGAPRTFGEGISSIGSAIASVIAGRGAEKMDAERAKIADAAFNAEIEKMGYESPLVSALAGQQVAMAEPQVALAETPPAEYGITPGAAGGVASPAFDLSSIAVGGATRPDTFTGMHDDFRGGLASMMASAPDDVRAGIEISSGYRSPERQQQLWNDALKKYGSAEKARKWVAPPGRSNHNHGMAADVKFTTDAAREWAHQNAGNFNLAFPLANEPWHIELAKARGGQPTPQAAAQPTAAQPTAYAPLNIPPAPQVNVSLIRALNNPYMSPEQRQVLATIYQQQQENQITPYQMAQLQMQQQQMAREGMITPYQQATLDMQAGQNQWEREKYTLDQQAAAAKAAADASQAGLTDDIREYQYAQQSGFPGSFSDWQLAQKKAGAASTNVTVGGAAPDLGKLSTDYGYVTDPVTRLPVIDPKTGLPTAAAVPGSPAAVEAAKAAQAGVAKEGNKAVSTDVITSAATKARQAAEGRQLGGFGQGIAASLPWTDSAEVARQVEVLKSNAKVENLQAMRAASPTGGALGAVSDSENAMLAAKAGALDPASPTFARDLDDYERTLLRIVHGPEAGDRIFNQTRVGGSTGSASDDDLLKKYGG